MTHTIIPRHRVIPASRSTSERSALWTVTFETSLGTMALASSDSALHGLVFGHTSRGEAIAALRRAAASFSDSFRPLHDGQLIDQPQWITGTIDQLRQFADGEPVDFTNVPLSLGHLTAFGKRVVGACRSIRWGQTRSYGQVAARCGSPGAARAVGTVMANNRFPLIVPCHRVLGSGGSLGGYSAPGGLRMKRRLLAMEASIDL